MTEVKKQPAHEVILAKLQSKVRGLFFSGRPREMVDEARKCELGHIELLVQILGEMAITESEREDVVYGLRKIAGALFGVNPALKQTGENISAIAGRIAKEKEAA